MRLLAACGCGVACSVTRVIKGQRSKERVLRVRQLCHAVQLFGSCPSHISSVNCIVITPVMTQFSGIHEEIQTGCVGLSVTFDPALGFMFDLTLWCLFSKPQCRAVSMELCRGTSSYVTDHTGISVMTDGSSLPDAPQQALLSHISGRSGTWIDCMFCSLCPNRPTEEYIPLGSRYH